MDDFSDLAHDARAWQAEAEADMAAAERVAAGIGALHGRATDRSGAVRITVDAAGALTDVRIDARAMTWTPHRLSQAVLATADDARRDFARAARALARDTLRERPNLLAHVEDGLRERTPPEPKESTW